MLSIHNRFAFALVASFATVSSVSMLGCVADSNDSSADDAAEEQTGEASQAWLSASSSEGFGWVWSSLTTSGTMTASSTYSYNSMGGVNTITNDGTGAYHVDFPGLSDVGGNVQVTSYGSSSERCKVSGWGGSPTLSVYVRCHTAGGAPVNTPFVVYYSRERNNYHGAYLWNDQASATLNTVYTPTTTYQYTAGSSYSTITRTGTGVYSVRVPGIGATQGTVHVTAYGGGPEYCNVNGWSASGSDTIINVQCFTTSGLAANTQFSLSYHRGSPSTGRVGGYAWANDPVSASYTPDPSYSGVFNTLYPCYFGPGITAGHNAPVGSHFVRYPQMSGINSTTMVTAYTPGSQYCKIMSWGGYNQDAQVIVQCYDQSGAAVDSRFTNTYLGTAMFTPC